NPTYSEDLANLYILNQKYDEALKLLDELDAKWGDSEYREGLRRQIYAQTNNSGAGIEDLQHRISTNPEEEENYLNLIFVYSEKGAMGKAFETAPNLLARHPEAQTL